MAVLFPFNDDSLPLIAGLSSVQEVLFKALLFVVLCYTVGRMLIDRDMLNERSVYAGFL